jgi:methionyl-tRNA formyltransferase
MARVVFMGTPEFAVPALVVLDQHHQVVGVVTQPDRPTGRGRKLLPSPIKKVALERGLEVLQPPSLHPSDVVQHLVDWRPDVIVVAAFGQILRPEVLALPPRGCLNIHASLLPHYRGAAPIPAAILAGDDKTGVTIMLMDASLDTGPILDQVETPIGPRDTTASLTDRLARMGATRLIESLPAWLQGRLAPQPQEDALATYCHPLRKEDGRLDWTRSASYLDRQVRANDPWPGTFTTWQGQRLKVLQARPAPDWPGTDEPGLVIAQDASAGVVTGEGLLELLEVQLAGKRAMEVEAFLRGQQTFVGSMLGR